LRNGADAWITMTNRTPHPNETTYAELGAAFTETAQEVERIRDELTAIRDRVKEAAARFGANVGGARTMRWN
jgi:uncharacterized coiled-coil protein SlyX